MPQQCSVEGEREAAASAIWIVSKALNQRASKCRVQGRKFARCAVFSCNCAGRCVVSYSCALRSESRWVSMCSNDCLHISQTFSVSVAPEAALFRQFVHGMMIVRGLISPSVVFDKIDSPGLSLNFRASSMTAPILYRGQMINHN